MIRIRREKCFLLICNTTPYVKVGDFAFVTWNSEQRSNDFEGFTWFIVKTYLNQIVNVKDNFLESKFDTLIFKFLDEVSISDTDTNCLKYSHKWLQILHQFVQFLTLVVGFWLKICSLDAKLQKIQNSVLFPHKFSFVFITEAMSRKLKRE